MSVEVISEDDNDIEVRVVGVPGPQGLMGPQGLPGIDGANGEDGAEGAVGPQGATGPAGIDGAVGPMGPVGPIGATGNTGAAGSTGAAGAQGIQGVQGPTGPQGAEGPVGPTGPQGAVGPQGPQGTVGPQGPQGVQGATGATGAQGPAGSGGGPLSDLEPISVSSAVPYVEWTAGVAGDSDGGYEIEFYLAGGGEQLLLQPNAETPASSFTHRDFNGVINGAATLNLGGYSGGSKVHGTIKIWAHTAREFRYICVAYGDVDNTLWTTAGKCPALLTEMSSLRISMVGPGIGAGSKFWLRKLGKNGM